MYIAQTIMNMNLTRRLMVTDEYDIFFLFRNSLNISGVNDLHMTQSFTWNKKSIDRKGLLYERSQNSSNASLCIMFIL